ncbi:hypothetical protein [Kribbella sp. NPDC023855]|uniref:hypothetical protein n=1 Tax=Kribbella sp. NPDC023855 TaxID=3154698 RepID=UPI0033D156FD
MAVDVFSPAEAHAFLTQVLREVPTGSDARAADRIAGRCGYLPLALGLVAGYIRGTSGWTLTDHAERLDERHRDRRLESGVELAFNVSHRHLPADQRRLLRLMSHHPDEDRPRSAGSRTPAGRADGRAQRIPRRSLTGRQQAPIHLLKTV